MATPIRIWTHATCHPAFRSGGWAFVRAIGDQVYGQAGGERAATTARMELAGVLAALRDLPSASGAVTVHSASAARFARMLQPGLAPDEGPTEDLVLWAELIAITRARPIVFAPAEVRPGTTLAFVAAWADLAGEKAKATGGFSAAIPKPNLAKAPGLGLA